MATLTMGARDGEHLAKTFDPSYNNEAVTVLSGQDLDAGAVLGRITKALAAAPIPTIVGTGSGAMTALTFGPKVQTGSYVITLLATSATAAFSVVAPDGTALPNGAVGTAYASEHVNFLISDGGTMTLGDSYTIAVTAGGTPAVIGGTGTGTMSAISLGRDAQNGGYQVRLRAAVSHGGDFDVIAPDGTSIGRFLMGTTTGASAAFTSSHINFTLTDATDFILGNYFNVIVAAGSGKVVAYTPTTFDGRHEAYGVLYRAVDASLADAAGVALARGPAIVESSALGWGASVTTAQRASALSALAAKGIVAR
jgi:hypothetical protein